MTALPPGGSRGVGGPPGLVSGKMQRSSGWARDLGARGVADTDTTAPLGVLTPPPGLPAAGEQSLVRQCGLPPLRTGPSASSPALPTGHPVVVQQHLVNCRQDSGSLRSVRRLPLSFLFTIVVPTNCTILPPRHHVKQQLVTGAHNDHLSLYIHTRFFDLRVQIQLVA